MLHELPGDGPRGDRASDYFPNGVPKCYDVCGPSAPPEDLFDPVCHWDTLAFHDGYPDIPPPGHPGSSGEVFQIAHQLTPARGAPVNWGDLRRRLEAGED